MKYCQPASFKGQNRFPPAERASHRYRLGGPPHPVIGIARDDKVLFCRV